MHDAHNTYRRKSEQPEVGILGRCYQQDHVHSLSVYAERIAETENSKNAKFLNTNANYNSLAS